MLLLSRKPKPDRWNFSSSDVIRTLRSESPENAALLERIIGDAAWRWIREFRERWFHLDPVRIAELGMQWRVDFNRRFWLVDNAAGTRTLPMAGSDAPEVKVSEMLERGRCGFNMFATQFALYVRGVEAKIRGEWQKWDAFAPHGRLRRPQKRPIRFLRLTHE
jgi:hypothetical protein